MVVSTEERSFLVLFFMAPIRMNMEIKDLFNIFTHLRTTDQQFIIKKCSELFILKYSDRINTYQQLFSIEIFSILLCLTANKVLLNDLSFNHYNHLDIFPITYQFFNYDKKHYTTMFQHYFIKIMTLMLHKEEDNQISFSSLKSIHQMFNKMFLSIKPNSYTGYFVVFNNFHTFVDELYSLYTLTNDEFYLTTLFNIPISLGLLISKCALIKKTMEQGIRVSCCDIVLAYFDYMIEFDASDVYNSLLDTMLILMKYTKDLKILNIINKFTTKHRLSFNKKIYEPQGLKLVNELLMHFDAYLIIRDRNGEIDLNYIQGSKDVVDLEYLITTVFIKNIENEETRLITKENTFLKLIINGYKQEVNKQLEALNEESTVIWANRKAFNVIFHYTLIYGQKNAVAFFVSPHLNIRKVVNNLIHSIYSQNDLIANRAVSLFCALNMSLNINQQIDLTMALKFKVTNIKSNRAFYKIRTLFEKLFVSIEYRGIFMMVFDKDCYRTSNSFLKSMYLYFEYKYALGPSTDILKDLDTEFLLNNSLKFYHSLYDHVEIFIGYITDKVQFVKLFNFYEKMKSRSVINYNNNIDFEEFLKPIKRYLHLWLL